MYVQRYTKRNGKKVYTSVYLARSYRDENGKVKREHVLNLSHLPNEEVESMELALQSRKKGSKVTFCVPEDIELEQHKSIGAVYVIKKLADRLGITTALGSRKDTSAQLVILMIMARIIFPGSKSSNIRWASSQEIENVLGINPYEMDENNLYAALDWLSEHQESIEKKLFKKRCKQGTISNLYLYDVTSSYLEGEKNELGMWGYNRDKKKGKKQIVIGLMTDESGMPVSVRVFKGNTSDTQTVPQQIKTLKDTFGVKHITLVGDKGMIKGPQIDALYEEDFNYITSISKKEIRTLLNKEKLQLSFFDNIVSEFYDEEDAVRYIYRRNPVRMKEMRENRNERITEILSFAAKKTEYLNGGKKREPEVALRAVESKIRRYNLKEILSVKLDERTISVSIDEGKKAESEKLDGCYVIKTDLPESCGEKEIIHERYKDLYKVECAFRTVKSELEIRPLFHRKAERTKAHVFMCMLAYMIDLEFKKLTKDLSGTTKEKWNQLDHLMTEIMTVGDATVKKSAKPNTITKNIFSALKIAPPKINKVIRSSET